MRKISKGWPFTRNLKYSEKTLLQEADMLIYGFTYQDVFEMMGTPIPTVCHHVNIRIRYNYPEVFKKISEAYEKRPSSMKGKRIR